MRLSTNDCNVCVNRNIGGGCSYRTEYTESIKYIESFLHNHTCVEWWGGLHAGCDYYVFDSSLDAGHCCG